MITALDHLVLTVADIPATLAFYQRALGMQPQSYGVADGSGTTSIAMMARMTSGIAIPFISVK